MAQLKKTEVAQIESLLRAKLKLVLDEVRNELDERENQHLAAVMGNHPGDSGDVSLADALADLNILLADKHVRDLRDIEAKLDQIGEGTLNECIDCGNTIGLQRLLANPTAMRCISCQQKHEQLYASPSHPAL